MGTAKNAKKVINAGKKSKKGGWIVTAIVGIICVVSWFFPDPLPINELILTAGTIISAITSLFSSVSNDKSKKNSKDDDDDINDVDHN